MLKSALTAQLAGGNPSEPAGQASKTQTSAPLDLLHDPAFPCLRYAKGDVVESADSRNEVEVPDVSKIQMAGTAPSSSLTADVADYELNPFKRRGGEEIMSSSFVGIHGSTPKRPTAPGSLINQAVIGSMPAGLSLDERNHILKSTPMSPSINLLNELGFDKAGARTREASKLRRQVLKGAVVVFVTAGYSGKRFIFQRCHDLGVRSVIIDGPDSWSQALVDEGLAEKFVAIDFTDADTLFERLLAACKQIRNSLGDLDGVVTFCELAVPLASRVAEQLGLPANTPDAVDTARNKHAARACMEAAGLPTPRNYLIESDTQLGEAAAKVGFPAVIKPISGAASIGVIRVNDIDQLRTSYARVMKDLKSAKVVAGALIEGDATDEGEADGNASSWIDARIMMEEYLDGPEVDVDLVFSAYKCVYGCVTDNWPTVEPYFNETGSNCPSLLSRAQQMELVDLGVKAVECMGFQLGVFHVELKYTSRGARLIEVNARMGGGPVRDTNLLVWGVDLVEMQVAASCGLPLRPAIAEEPLNELAEFTVNAQVTGILEGTDFIREYEQKEGVLYARPIVQPGHHCVCVEDGLPTWLAEMMVSMKPVDKAVQWIQELAEEINSRVRITPKPLRS